MKGYHIFYILLFFFCSCNHKKGSTEILPISDSKVFKEEDTLQKEMDNISEKEIDTSVFNTEAELISKFLSFYQENYDSINDKDFLDVNNEYYRIDFEVVDDYLNKLDSTYLSNIFKKRLLNNMKNIDLKLQSSLQNDGIPEGLEFDMILKTQEVDEILNMIKKKKYHIETCKDIENCYLLNISNLHCLLFYLNKGKISAIKICNKN